MAFSTTGLPVIPYTLTTKIDGKEYETHVLTNTCQVITEDGTPLCDVLNKLTGKSDIQGIVDELKRTSTFFKIKGTLRHLPEISAIEQLYAKQTPLTGEVWLVESNSYGAKNKVYDMYVYYQSISNWVYAGTTKKEASPGATSEILSLFPNNLGRPGQYLMVKPDGTGLMWGYTDSCGCSCGGSSGTSSVDFHNMDKEAHQDIRDELSLKSDKMIIFNDTIYRNQWFFDGDEMCYKYIYTNNKISQNAYFEITPHYETEAELESVRYAEIKPVYGIHSHENGAYAILKAMRVPKSNFAVSIKIFGEYDEEKKRDKTQ